MVASTLRKQYLPRAKSKLIPEQIMMKMIDKVWEQKFPGEPWNLEPRKHGNQQAEHQNGELEKKSLDETASLALTHRVGTHFQI